MQVIIIAGNVGNVKDVKDAAGDRVLNFSVAVDNGKDKSGERKESTWYDCAIWGKRADSLAPYIVKGGKLTVTGRPSARAYDGKAHMEVSVDQLTLMGGGGASEPARPSAPQQDYDLDDGIPF